MIKFNKSFLMSLRFYTDRANNAAPLHSSAELAGYSVKIDNQYLASFKCYSPHHSHIEQHIFF